MPGKNLSVVEDTIHTTLTRNIRTISIKRYYTKGPYIHVLNRVQNAEYQLLRLALYLKKNLSGLDAFVDQLKIHYPLDIPLIKNWHQIDALMAWWTGYRHNLNDALEIGNPQEGLIIY